jgi:peptidoglycan-N-acetylglucosamine deacetylase
MAMLGWLLRRLPLIACRMLALPVVWAWFQHWNHPRICVTRAMARLGVARPYWAAWRVFKAYGVHLLERHYLFGGRATARLEPDEDGRAALDAAIASEQPTVLLGSHAGALELAGLLLGPTGRSIVAVTARDDGAEQLLRLVGDPAKRLGSMHTIVADGSARSGLAMLDALKSGQLLGLKADRPLPGTPPSETVVVPLFGEPARLPLGPAKLARAVGARAIVVSVVRTGSLRYRILSEELPPHDSPEELVRDYARVIEGHVSTHPDQWFNFHPVWESDRAALAGVPPTVPPGLRAFGRGLARAALWLPALVGAVSVALLLAGASVPLPLLIGSLIALIGVLGPLALMPGLQVFGPVPCRGTSTSAVALTFDDGPDPAGTPAVLEALAAAQAKATFFVLGRQVEAHPELARALVAGGHEIALHGYDHRFTRAFLRSAMAADLARAEEVIHAVCGVRPRLYRPPAGLVVPSLLDAARARGLEVVGWSVRPRDGLGGEPKQIVERVLRGISAGDVVLLHDVPSPVASDGRVSTAVALPEILEGLAHRGLRAETVSEVMDIAALQPPGWEPPTEVRPRRTLQELVVGPVLLALLVAIAATVAAG